MMDMKSLNGAKALQADKRTAADDAKARAAPAAAVLLARHATVATLEQDRAGFVAACKASDVLACDGLLLEARIECEIAEARAATIRAECHAATIELHAAEAAVGEAAQQCVIEQMVDLAAEVSRALNHALEIGGRLQALAMRDAMQTPLSKSIPLLPPEVEAALQRLPQPDPMHVPMNVLRNGNTSRAWFERIAELTT
jgi:hypothetical protein